MLAAGESLECVNSNMTSKAKEKTKQKWNQKTFLQKNKPKNPNKVWINTFNDRKMLFQVFSVG